jgi:ATP-dependent helicase HrpA
VSPYSPDLRARVELLTIGDAHRLGQRLNRLSRRPDDLAGFERDLARAEERLAKRQAAVPAITYPDLPVAQRREDLLAAIRDHQVVVVAGETGSGKTTQLPKLCLELGRGVRGMIGHTQPRRIAARTVAERIAEEVGSPLGQAIGYSVRFSDRVSDATLVRVMTDGVLLAEIGRDRQLHRYDTIIVDEAHERSLNIDFLLGYLARLLPQRPDLKLIVTSATIDPEKFAAHFGGAPIVEVSGRTYPVEVRYRPLLLEADEDDEEVPEARDPVQAVADAVVELGREGEGDVLVFCSGEREIRDTADALNALDLPRTEVLPLYARLSAAEQHRVFEPHTGRRIVLATNVAETSLTVPGIRYVVDPGTARISRWNARTGVQRLPIEPVSQASARQRAGRCGRVAPGICIRLYAEDDFDGRPAFTDPEIQRTGLAAVVLQMAALGLGEVEDFPFLDAPDRRSIRDAVGLLHELGALDPELTPVGRKLARLPVDPRLGRAVLEADRRGCTDDVMVIVAALSIPDPRERPADEREAADQAHRRFRDESSDFLSLLALWRYLQEQQEALSSGQFRRMCRREYLHYLRVREWQDLYGQLRSTARDLGLSTQAEPGEPDARGIHTALLSGLLSRIGLYDDARREYLGAKGTRFALWPGSALARKSPRWVMAAELVETSRLFGRTAARIDPGWLEPLAGHLVQREYAEPHWDRARGAVMAEEKVTLFGIPIVRARPVTYSRIDPGWSRELFLTHALVENDWDTHHAFATENARRRDEVSTFAARARRTDLEPDRAAQYRFFDERVPAEALSQRAFDAWWKQQRLDTPDLLTVPLDVLLGAAPVHEDDFPDEWTDADGSRYPLEYTFAPGTSGDGVTVVVPLAKAATLDANRLGWLVPGLRQELVTALVRGLPKQLRRTIGPAPEAAAAVLAAPDAGTGPLLDVAARELQRQGGAPIPPEAWQPGQLPAHLRMTVRVVDETGRIVAEGKDLAAVRATTWPLLRGRFREATADVARTGLRDWDFDELPRQIEHEVAGTVVRGYPSLVDRGDAVAIEVLDAPRAQAVAMRAGTRRLLALTLPSQTKALRQRLGTRESFALAAVPGGIEAVVADATGCAIDHLLDAVPWDKDAFAALRDRVRQRLPDAAAQAMGSIVEALAAVREVDAQLGRLTGPAAEDLKAQRDRLFRPGFATRAGWSRLPHLARYAVAMQRRLERLPLDPARDRQNAEVVHRLEAEVADLRAQLPDGDPRGAALDEVGWSLEELRVSLFAQQLGTAGPVSAKRISRQLDEIADGA